MSNTSIIDQIKEMNWSLLLATDNHLIDYQSSSLLYSFAHLNVIGTAAYILDFEGSSRDLISFDMNINKEHIAELNLEDPSRVYIIFVGSMKKEKLEELFTSFGVPYRVDLEQIDKLYLSPLHASYNNHWAKRFRHKGNGAIIYFVNVVDNVFSLAKEWDSVHELAKVNFNGYFIQGPESFQIWRLLTSRSQLSAVASQMYEPVTSYKIVQKPKKLRVCYVDTFIRFMAIENIKYYLAHLDKELFEQIEWVELSSGLVSKAIEKLEESVCYLNLMTTIEYAQLAVEAYKSANVVVGFKGTLDAISINQDFTDFSPEQDYQDVAHKLHYYLKDMLENSKDDEFYLHDKAKKAQAYAEQHFNSSRFKDSVFQMLKSMKINIS